MPIQKFNESVILAAIQGFESQKIQINQQIAELKALLTGRSAETPVKTEATARKRRRMSAAGRKAIAEAQRKRWAALKGQSEAVTPAVAPVKRKRRLSAAGRAAISAATKKRWAMKRAAEGAAKKAARSRKKSATKKAAVSVPADKAA